MSTPKGSLQYQKNIAWSDTYEWGVYGLVLLMCSVMSMEDYNIKEFLRKLTLELVLTSISALLLFFDTAHIIPFLFIWIGSSRC